MKEEEFVKLAIKEGWVSRMVLPSREDTREEFIPASEVAHLIALWNKFKVFSTEVSRQNKAGL